MAPTIYINGLFTLQVSNVDSILEHNMSGQISPDTVSSFREMYANIFDSVY